jgi:tRNA threonylcarbamoyladenosine biosynthesis protein TsaB
MREVYYAALEEDAGRWRETVPAQCVAPERVSAPPGEGWVGCGNGFNAYEEMLRGKVSVMKPEMHPSALAVAKLAAPRLAAGEGVDAALAAPRYVREKVAFTQEELSRK